MSTRKAMLFKGKRTKEGVSIVFDGVGALERTFAQAASDNSRATVSGWLKLHAPDNGIHDVLLSYVSAQSSSADCSFLSVSSGQDIYSQHGTVADGSSVSDGRVRSAGKFRDPTAWYHLCAVYDFDHPSSAERIQFYINGERVDVTTQDTPAAGSELFWARDGFRTLIGANGNNALIYGEYGKYALSEFHFLDGVAGSPYDFGEWDADGVTWIPKRWTESYTATKQDIATTGAIDWDVFEVGGETYALVANFSNGTTTSVNSTLYQWNATTRTFTAKQNIATVGAVGWEVFTAGGETFALVANYYNGTSYNQNSALYQWNTETKEFDVKQNIATVGAYDWEVFEVGGETFALLARYADGTVYTQNSNLYQWNAATKEFSIKQNIPTTGAYDWEVFTVGGETFALVANYYEGTSYNQNSVLYQWNTGTKEFDVKQNIATVGATEWEVFAIDGTTYALVTNYSNGTTELQNSVLYEWNTGTKEFDAKQYIPTIGAQDWRVFNAGTKTYALVANYYDGTTPNQNSVLYEWNAATKEFDHKQDIPTNGALKWEVFTSGGETFVLVANHVKFGGDYTINSALYKWTANRDRLLGNPVTTYGTNGFHLCPLFPQDGKFDPLDPGKDFSGNGNDFTVVGTVAAGFDNPLSNNHLFNEIAPGANAPTNGGLTQQTVLNYLDNVGPASMPVNRQGVSYMEFTLDADATASANTDPIFGVSVPAKHEYVWYFADGRVISQTGQLGTVATYTIGDRLGVRYDASSGDVSLYKNGALQGTYSTGFAHANVAYFDAIDGDTGGTATWTMYASDDWLYETNKGFEPSAANSASIIDPKDYISVQTITVTGDGQFVPCGFQPDFVELKRIDAAGDWYVFDSVQGPGQYIRWNDSQINRGISDANSLISFDAGGFTLGTSIHAGEYHVRCLRKLAGFFDIVSYVGDGVAGRTIAHSLGVAPSVIMTTVLNSNFTSRTLLGYADTSFSGFISVQDTLPYTVSHDTWNSTVPNSANYTVGTSISANQNARNIVAYLFANHPDLFWSGAYTGNGNADGPFVSLPFKAGAFVSKRTDAVGAWNMSLGAENPDARLSMNFTNAITTSIAVTSSVADKLATGHKFRGSGADTNANGGTYFFMAFAEDTIGPVPATAR